MPLQILRDRVTRRLKIIYFLTLLYNQLQSEQSPIVKQPIIHKTLMSQPRLQSGLCPNSNAEVLQQGSRLQDYFITIKI